MKFFRSSVVLLHPTSLPGRGFKEDPIHWVLIRAILSSVANTAIVAMQDLLGLGSEARMNLPGVPSGFWKWRMKPGAATKEIAAMLKELAMLYDR